MLQTIQNVPLNVNLLDYINSTGWSITNGIASHDKYTEGDLKVKGVTLLGAMYDFTFTVKTLNGGSLFLYVGSTLVATVTVAGFYTASIPVSSSDIFFRAQIGSTVELSSFTYKKSAVPVSPTQRSTISYSEKIEKWTSFYTYNPDYGFSLKGKLFTLKDGKLYKHDISAGRNRFYGTEYKSTIEFPMNQALNVVKNFQSIEIQSNTLLVSTLDGVKTSLGQVSDVFAEDFKQFTLNAGVTSVDVYSLEGVYQARFLRDKHTDIIEGDRLKGNFMTIELTTIDEQDFKLYRVYVNAEPSFSGI